MPFKKNSAYKLTLAITAILYVPWNIAHADQNAWACDRLPNGEWDCHVSNDLPVRPAEQPTPPVTQPVAQPAEDTRTPVQAAQPAAETQVPAQPEPSTVETQTPTPPAQLTEELPTLETPVQAERDVLQLGRFNKPVAGNSGILLDNPFAHLDWYPKNTDEPMLCPGGYIEPEIAYLEPNIEVGNEAVYAEADLSSTDLQGGLARLTGGVIIQQGERLFTSRYGEVDNNSGTAFLEDTVTFREPGLLLVGTRAETDFNTGISSFYSSEFVMHLEHLRGHAETITRYDDQRVTFRDGAVTYCEPGNNAWSIASYNITLHPDRGYGEATHMTFRVKDVPVFYLPYFRFPIDDTRQSGFLYPSLGVSKSDGVDISIPYYFNLGPNLDDTLNLRYIEKRGLLLENELRYLNTWSNNTLSLAYLSNDQKSDRSNRWLTGFEHRGRPADRWSSRIDYTHVSDIDYFSDLGTSLDVQRSDHLDQRGQLQYQGNGWRFLANLHEYQTINDNRASPYQRSPQLLLTGNERVLNNQARLNYQAEYVRFTRDRKDFFSNSSDLRRTEAQRIHIRPTLQHRTNRPWGFMDAALTGWHSSYDFDFPEQAETGFIPNSVTAGIASIDSGLYFDRDFNFRGSEYSQSLEPRLMLLHVDKSTSQPTQGEFRYFDSSRLSFSYNNLFDRYGWSGNDRISETSQITYGVSSAIYNERGSEQARIAIAQAYYLRDRDLNDLRPGDNTGIESSSNLALLAQWNITPNLRLRHDSEIDRDSYSMEEQNYQLTWRPDDENIFYLSYRDRLNSANNRARTRQSDLVYRNQINPQWATIARWQHDLENRQRLDTILGLEYGTCC